MKLLLFLLLLPCALFGGIVQKTVSYVVEGVHCEGNLVYEDELDKSAPKLPGIILFPNWMEPTAATFRKAGLIAQTGYVVFVADMYGSEIRPQSSAEAAQASGEVRKDRDLMRSRAKAAISTFFEQVDTVHFDSENSLAIGFCFGGGTVLELARSGEERLRGVVSFHGPQ